METCPNCKCIVSDFLGKCPVCNQQFVNKAAENDRLFREKIERDREHDEQLRKRQKEIDTFQSSYQQSISSYTFNNSLQKRMEKINRRIERKKRRTFKNYLIIGLVSFFISQALSLGFDGFWVIAIFLIFVFLF